MPRLPASGSTIDTPRRAEEEFKTVLHDLGVAHGLDEAAVHELYWKLGEIIALWSREQERLETAPVAKAFLSISTTLTERSRLLRGLETGYRSNVKPTAPSPL